MKTTFNVYKSSDSFFFYAISTLYGKDKCCLFNLFKRKTYVFGRYNVLKHIRTPFKCIIEFQQSFYSEKICKGGPLLFSAASGADLIEMTWNKFNACSLFFVSVQDNVEMRRQNLLAV